MDDSPSTGTSYRLSHMNWKQQSLVPMCTPGVYNDCFDHTGREMYNRKQVSPYAGTERIVWRLLQLILGYKVCAQLSMDHVCYTDGFPTYSSVYMKQSPVAQRTKNVHSFFFLYRRYVI